MAAVYKSIAKANGEQRSDEQSQARKKARQRVLILSSRGVTHRHRHLLNDLAALMPHSRKDAKFDSKTKLFQLNELAELYNCNNVLFFEARKGKDLYMWISKVPNGPTVKMHVQNMHTMEELHFTGNCLKGSRPVLSFDAAFDREPHLQLLKELFVHVFGVPQGARRSKPFVDHVMGFTIADGKVWVRNYQINEVEAGRGGADGDAEDAEVAVKNDNEDDDDDDGDDDNNKKNKKKAKAAKDGRPSKDTDISLVEIGPRFVLTPIVVQEGSFGGPIIYENRQFVSPNQVRSDLRRNKATRHNERVEQQRELLAKKDNLGLRTDGSKAGQARDALDTKALFA
ncbi:Brix domain protein [Niveomyces insectorum RCEF 264]|uniref:Brix domain protein n=1 Tax=Niveomyces insectorum RCEF 264 TaxID=1081102 RepID=A0A167NTV7_9HYPO|nr:Brix domain protein [Niveomyces insectorum RCEF 264]